MVIKRARRPSDDRRARWRLLLHRRLARLAVEILRGRLRATCPAVAGGEAGTSFLIMSGLMARPAQYLNIFCWLVAYVDVC